MITICGWHGGLLGQYGRDSGEISHGICKRCAAELVAELDDETNRGEYEMSENYERAMARLDAEPELDAHREAIESDWRELDHWQWIAEAPIAEIVAWAEEIEANAE